MPIHDWRSVGDDVFHDFHLSWIAELRGVLNRRILPSGYYALAERYFSGMVSDVLTLREEDARGAGGGPEGATALATVLPRTQLVMMGEWEAEGRPVSRTVVIRKEGSDDVVALIEIVSRGNKKNQRDFNAFLQKLAAAVAQGIHLLLIDLQPPTSRDPEGIHAALWEALGFAPYEGKPDRPLTLASYSAGSPVRAFVEPTAVGASMSEMPLFLDPEWYVSVPLEETYREAFAGVPREFRRILEAIS